MSGGATISYDGIFAEGQRADASDSRVTIHLHGSDCTEAAFRHQTPYPWPPRLGPRQGSFEDTRWCTSLPSNIRSVYL